VTDPRVVDARWAVVEELDSGRWRLVLRDEADDELIAVGLGIQGVFDVDVEPAVAFLLARLGLTTLGSRPWRADELGDQRAAVIPG
jgi:hypothetical protein